MSNNIPGTTSGGTFLLSSRYPELCMPGYRVDDETLVDPRSDNLLLSGEWVRVGVGQSEAGAVPGTRRIFAIQDSEIQQISPAPTTFQDYQDGSGRRFAVESEFRMRHGRPGRSDTQFFGNMAIIDDRDFEFRYRLTDKNATYAVGDSLFIAAIAPADLPDYIRKPVARNVMGLVPYSFLIAGADNAANGALLQAVAYCTSPMDSSGWITAKCAPHLRSLSV